MFVLDRVEPGTAGQVLLALGQMEIATEETCRIFGGRIDADEGLAVIE